MVLCYHNNTFGPVEECRLPVTDLIIQRGVGVFESIRTYDKHTFAMGPHLDRLAESARLSGIAADKILSQLPDIINEGLRHPDAPEGDMLIKPFVTGGLINNRGHFPAPDFFVIFEEMHPIAPETIKNGITLQPSYLERPFPLIKTTSYLTGLIPMRDAPSNVYETLYCCGGEITESLRSSFYLCIDGKLITAPVGKVLRGVTREIILTLASENGFQIEERCPNMDELPNAQEAFISGSAKEVLSVVKVGTQKIGLGRPGPVAKHIHKLFLSNISRWLDK